MSSAWIAVAAVGLSFVGPATVSARGTVELDRAKQLYEDAHYAEALRVLESVSAAEAGEDADEEAVARYRVLCLLALGRTDDANRVVGEYLQQFPTRALYTNETPPKLADLVRRRRRELLPVLVRSRLSDARGAFEDGRLERAEGRFREVLALLGMPEAGPTLSPSVVTDMRVLAEGFLLLIEGRRIDTDARSTFEDGDADVVAPVPLRQELPRWTESFGRVTNPPRRSMLDIWVTETGDVERVALRQSLHPYYDGILLATARTWKYRPAQRHGRAVKYHRVMAITLTPP